LVVNPKIPLDKNRHKGCDNIKIDLKEGKIGDCALSDMSMAINIWVSL
jgi:hypothetical protein